MGCQEGIGERNVDPTQEFGVTSRVLAHLSAHRIHTSNLSMHPAHSSTFSVGHRCVAERHHRQPLGGSCQPTQRVLFIPRVLHHSGECSRVQGLHQQRSHSPNERGQRPVHRPCRGPRAEIAGINSVGQLSHPFGAPFRIAGNDATEPLGDSISRHIDGAGHRKHAVRVPSDRVSRTLT